LRSNKCFLGKSTPFFQAEKKIRKKSKRKFLQIIKWIGKQIKINKKEKN
jgi:hypothetical protein